MSASSPDGLTWTHDGIVLLEHASVPCAVAMPDGRIRIYYVDANQQPETTNVAESTDGGASFTPLGLTITNMTAFKALDPCVVTLNSGRYRLFYYGSAQNVDQAGEHHVYSAISDDGVSFEAEGEALAYNGLVDPDVFKAGAKKWYMFVFSLTDGTTVVASSKNGRKFTYKQALGLPNWGTTKPVKLSDGTFRLYAFDQRTGKTFSSFTSTDGLNWTQEAGVRLTAPEGKKMTDPFVIQLPDGSWKMYFKMEDERTPR
jgi:hypothetical protein